MGYSGLGVAETVVGPDCFVNSNAKGMSGESVLVKVCAFELLFNGVSICVSV